MTDSPEARGRAYGEDEARRRGEDPEHTADRVKRAVEYARWEQAGKPILRDPVSARQREDWKQGRKKKGDNDA